ncbi:hypothetical protein [Roseovarius sp. Pro17]|nr:hypothetical protein [Roseovarius sp. Pro17]
MKAFLLALAALVAITVGANWILVMSNFSAEAAWASTSNVRIND